MTVFKMHKNMFSTMFLLRLSVLLSVVHFSVGSRLFSSTEHVNTINARHNCTWKAGFAHKFEEMPWTTVRGMMGAWPERNVVERNSNYVSRAPIPSSFDSRLAWPQCASIIGDIRDQSACGSCWAVSTAAAISDRLCIRHGHSEIEVSSADLMSCCDSCGNGCEGGMPSNAFEYFSETGLVTGGNYSNHHVCDAYPFPPCEHHNTHTTYAKCPSALYNTPACRRACQSAYNATWEGDLHRGGQPIQSSTIEEIQHQIMTYGPMVMTFSVYEDFLVYKSGVYTHESGAFAGGHAVKVIGWGVESGVDYWLIANSWNEDWGEKGYFKIRRGVDECGIENGASGIIL